MHAMSIQERQSMHACADKSGIESLGDIPFMDENFRIVSYRFPRVGI